MKEKRLQEMIKERVREFFLVTLGASISAIGFNTMFVHNGIVSGGIGGLAVSFKELFGWNPAYFTLAVNVPLLVFCFIFLGKANFMKTLYGSWIYPILIKMTDFLPALTRDPLLAAIFGGLMVGFGLGLVFLGNSSTGGTGIITQIIHKYSPLSLGMIMIIIDGIVVATGLIAFSSDTVMYSIIALGCISYVVNTVVTGFNTSKNVMVISQKHDIIKEHITKVTDRGVTEFPVLGGFTGHEKRLLMTVVTSQELAELQRDLTTIDETAFVIVMPAAQVIGRGFSITKDHAINDDELIIPM